MRGNFFFNLDCLCNSEGSYNHYCNDEGKCPDCKDHIVGDLCDSCETGYDYFPECNPIEFIYYEPTGTPSQSLQSRQSNGKILKLST